MENDLFSDAHLDFRIDKVLHLSLSTAHSIRGTLYEWINLLLKWILLVYYHSEAFYKVAHVIQCADSFNSIIKAYCFTIIDSLLCF